MEGTALAIRVILVRHGETSFNAEGRVQGHIDISTLTEKGIADAQKVGQALLGIPIQSFYCSPLKRAQQTAQEIWKVLSACNSAIAQPAVNSNLIEISLPLWEGLLFDEVKVQFPAAYRAWHKAPHQLSMEDPAGGEPFFPVLALFEQAKRLWSELLPAHADQAANQTILLVGHSGINRSLICTALGLPPERYQTLQQANCNISILNFTDNTLESAQLESLNITSHLGLPIPDVRKTHNAVRLLLVRHGETDWNRQGRFQGQIDVPLNETGHQQAQQAADFLSIVPLDFAVTSSMKRPKETAQAILKQQAEMPLGEEPNFREISHGTWEGKFEAEIEQEYSGELERWRTEPETVQMPEGENLQQVWDRATTAWDEMVQIARAKFDPSNGKTRVGLVVAHDATNKVILSHVVGAGADKFWCFKQGNGAVSVIDYPAEGPPILQAMNITTHLGGVLDRTAAGAL
jgi:phosphoserine phosphatase